MVYDSTAQRLAIKAIGTVESNLNYNAVNYNDPITIGFMQWYGTRAAGLLSRIRTDNPSSWTGVSGTITSALDTYAVNDSGFWTNRYLTRAEGESLRPVLENNKAIQNLQAIDDLDAYVNAAERAGMDKDNNTESMLFFFVMYHQSPRRALSLLASMGPQSSIQRLYQGAMNEPVLGRYRSRYTTARDIILSGDPSGIDDVPGTVDPETGEVGDSGSGDGTVRPHGSIAYLEVVGDCIFAHMASGDIVYCYPNGSGRFSPGLEASNGEVVTDPGFTNPDPSNPGGGTATQNALREFMVSRLDRYAYSQGPARMKPEESGYTDCSALVWFAYDTVAGVYIGSYTGNQYNRGEAIYSGPGSGLTESGLNIGDLIFFGRSSAAPYHVEMYIGGGQICGHGGPDDGPDIAPFSLAQAKNYVWVRRYV